MVEILNQMDWGGPRVLKTEYISEEVKE